MLAFVKLLWDDVWQWLATPWAVPLIGAFGAVLAALTVEPASWLRGPVRAIGRATVVAAAWIVAVWILQKASGRPGGDVIESPVRASTDVVISPSVPAGASAEGLTVRFLPSNGDPRRAKAFCCELVIPGHSPQVPAQVVTIRETSMDAFRGRLSLTLRDHASTEGSPPWGSATIAQQPFPGEPAILAVTGCIKATFPNITIARVVREERDHQ